VMFSPEFLTVEKEEDGNWAHIKPEIFSLTMEHLLSGQPILAENKSEAEDTKIQEGDSETVQMIKELLETRIRPAIMEDGGDIEFRGFENGEVLLKLRGACRTCDSSVVTLKNGIEAMMRHYLPDVTSVRQVMDDEEEIALKEFEKLEAKLSAQKRPEAVSETGNSRV
jgi:NFU1 iron-sulfur cluster scaffold homolog, mitochondrial